MSTGPRVRIGRGSTGPASPRAGDDIALEQSILRRVASERTDAVEARSPAGYLSIRRFKVVDGEVHMVEVATQCCVTGGDRVAGEDESGHWANAAGYRRDRSGDLAHGRKVHVTDELALDDADPEVEHGRRRIDHIRPEETGDAGRHGDKIRTSRVGRQIPGATVAEGDGRVALRQHRGEWPTDHVAAADDDGRLSFEANVVVVEHFKSALGVLGRSDGSPR